MRRILVLGGPGAGKTTRLLAIMEQALARGLSPSRIAFVAFTNAAANEARTRACKKFGLTEKELPYFRTIHSLAYRQLGLRRGDIMGKQHLDEIANLTGELFGSNDSPEDGPAAGMSADPLLTLDQYARTTKKTLHQAWQDHGGDLDWFRLKRFVDAYDAYKEDLSLLDFTDLLEQYLNVNLAPLDVELAIVDEAQDLTLLQWEVIEHAFSRADDLYVAGDDLQSIHRWAGAAEDYFLSLEDYERQVLPVSHRLPRTIFSLAQGVAARVTRKYEREWSPADREGAVHWFGNPDEVDLSAGTWLLLARTRAQLPDLAAVAQEQGVLYKMKGRSSVDMNHVRAIQAYEGLRAGKRVGGEDVRLALKAARVHRSSITDGGSYTAAELGFDASPIWHDALLEIPLDTREYYLSCLRREEKLTAEPRVRIDTIHGVKGAEAEHVLLVTDLTYRTQRGYELDPDSEGRVFYVGVTRASQTLNLVAPQTAYGYPL